MNAETLKELLANATDGPWELYNFERFDGRYTYHYNEIWDTDLNVIASEVCRAHNDSGVANMRLIALAPELAADNIALQAEVDRLRKALREISAGIFNDNGDVTSIGPIAIERIARAALNETPEPAAPSSSLG